MNTFLITGIIAVPLSILFSYLVFRFFGIIGKKSTVSSEEEIDLDKFSLFTIELAFMLHVRAENSEKVLQSLMKIRVCELKEMVINNLKNFTYIPEGPKCFDADNSEIKNKIDDMLINFDLYVNDYMKTKYN